MKTFLDTINEAIQRNPAFKEKIKKMQEDFEKAFGNMLYSEKFDYDICKSDLEKTFMLANKWFFKNRLNIDDVAIVIIDNAVNHKDKGTFKLGVNENNKHQIGVIKYVKDNFYQVVNVFLHEMIHLYDSYFGPLKDKSNIQFIDVFANKQFVDRYDAHGKYFKDWCNKINAYGFDVQEKYDINSKKVMKKIFEKKRHTNEFFDEKNEENDIEYAKVKAFYDSLTNCNKDMVYRDSKHWYVQID